MIGVYSIFIYILTLYRGYSQSSQLTMCVLFLVLKPTSRRSKKGGSISTCDQTSSCGIAQFRVRNLHWSKESWHFADFPALTASTFAHCALNAVALKWCHCHPLPIYQSSLKQDHADYRLFIRYVLAELFCFLILLMKPQNFTWRTLANIRINQNHNIESYYHISHETAANLHCRYTWLLEQKKVRQLVKFCRKQILLRHVVDIASCTRPVIADSVFRPSLAGFVEIVCI